MTVKHIKSTTTKGLAYQIQEIYDTQGYTVVDIKYASTGSVHSAIVVCQNNY